MRIVMLSWEYPPRIVGGIARHIYDLSHALHDQGVEVHVITCEHPGAAPEEVEDGIHLYRVSPVGQANDFVHWVHLLNNAMYTRAERLIEDLLGHDSSGSLLPPDPANPIILHAHDWLAHFSAAPLKHKYKLPLVATIHATEYGRNNGIHNSIQQYINHIEWNLQNEAWRLIVCTDFMRRECEKALGTAWDKMDVIYNGVEPTKFELPGLGDEELAQFRSKYALPHEKLIFFVGRMVREKGVQVLIEALPKVRSFYRDAKLIVVGGGHREHLVQQARALGIERYVYFTGFVPDEDLMKIYKVIDVASFPSLYEPFGIVALEAMAAHVPVVVSDAGGLPEVVRHGTTGVTTYAGNANSLADGLLSVLINPLTAKSMADAAYESVLTTFNWANIASQTRSVYDRVWSEYTESGWAFPAPGAVASIDAASAATPVASAAVEVAPAVAPVDAAPVEPEAPAKPKRTRKTAPKADAAAEPAPAVEPVVEAATTKRVRKPKKTE